MNEYEIVQKELLYQGIFRLVRLHIKHRLYKGGWSEVFTREVLERHEAVAVLLYDPILDRVVLIEQFRPGALKNTSSPWQIEIVAGMFETNEQPTEVAIREAEEEAGCHITDLEPIYDYFVSPGGSNEYIHIYCGRVDASSAGGIHGLKEEHEDIRVLNLLADEAFEKCRRHEVKNAPAIIALQWLELNRNLLSEKWKL